MDKVPAEILRKIFLETILELYEYLDEPGYTDPDELPTREYIDRPLCLTHVCRLWREVAISFSTLWSYFLIERDAISRRRHFRSLFDMWLERSKGAPLSYKFDIALGATAVYVAKALLSQQHRWADVEFCWPGEVWADALENYPDRNFDMTNMPVLNSLFVYCKFPLHFKIDLSQSARLRKLTLSGDFDLVGKKDALPLLTSKANLCFSRGKSANDAAHSCLNFLEAACSLEELHVRFEWGPRKSKFAPGTSKRMVTAPRLRKLMVDSDIGESRTFLDSVTLPSLKVLQYSTFWSDEPILPFIKRSLPPLTFLSLSSVERVLEEEPIIEALRLLPTLEDLRLLHTSISTRFFRALMVDSTEEGKAKTLCPKLHTLYLRKPQFSEDATAWGHAFLDMLESRQQIMDYFDEVGLSMRQNAWVDVASLRKLSAEDWKEVSNSGRLFVTPYKELRDAPFTLTADERIVALLLGD